MPNKKKRSARLDKFAKMLHEVGRRHVLAVGAVYFVAAWLLVQIASIVLPSFDAPESIMRGVIITAVIGFPVAIVLSWIFNITPGGIVRVSEQEEAGAQRMERSARSALLDDSLQSQSSKVVAVLPFANRSELKEDAFFTEGIHDELLTHLSKVSAVQVISRTSVLRYRNTEESIVNIARELGAAVVLEGAVQRAGKRVRIIVQLIDGKNDVHLWAETFDRELTTDNLFDIQAEITRVIASKMEAALTHADQELLEEVAPTQILAAYDDYLRGQLLARSEAVGEYEIREAIKAFDSAIEKDPEYAEAYAGKARAQLTLYWFYGWDGNWVTKAEQSVARAKELHPDAVEVLLAEAYYHYWGKLDYAPAEAALNKVISKAPSNAEAWACRAYVIRRAGQFEESIFALEKAVKLNPMLIDLPMELSTTLVTFGRFEEATYHLNRVKKLDPDSPFTAYYVGDGGYLEGDANKAWEGANHPVTKYDFVYCYRRVFHAINTRDEDKILHSINAWPEEFYRTDSFPVTFEMMHAMALTCLNKQQEAQEIILEIEKTLGGMDELYPGGWRPDAPYFPVTLPGLKQDLDGVREAVLEYESKAKFDKFGAINHYHAVATAFAQCDDNNSALNYLEKLVDLFGPSAFLAMTITPAYDNLRATKRYLALEELYLNSHIAKKKSVGL